MPDNNCKPEVSKGEVCFVVRIRHWRSGKILDARDYGYKAWPIRSKKK